MPITPAGFFALGHHRIHRHLWLRAYVHGQAGDTVKMNQQLEAAEEMLEMMANENLIDARIQMALGDPRHARGKEAALMRGKQAIALNPLDKNKITAQRVHIDFAKIYLRLGMKDECIGRTRDTRDKPLGMEVGVSKNR